jgi:hypothetical protein
MAKKRILLHIIEYIGCELKKQRKETKEITINNE